MSYTCTVSFTIVQSPYPLVVALPAEVEDAGVDLEEMDAEFDVTYTKDISLMTEEEKAEQLRIEQEEAAKAIKKRVVKDGTSEKPAEETVALDESEVLPEEEICELDVQQHEDETGTHEVNVVPTYVRPQTEKVVEADVAKSALQDKAAEEAKMAKEAAKQKARRLGTVSSLLNKFKPPEIKEEPITESVGKPSAETIFFYFFSKAEEEKARWKERRDAETERELAKIEGDRRGKKKVVVEEPKKRTVRKIVKDKAPAAGTGKATAASAAPVPSFATVPKVPTAPAQAAAAPSAPKVPVQTTAAAAAAPAAATAVGVAAKKEQNVAAPATGVQTKAGSNNFM
ncbi:hypothetical protein ANCDUO_07028 [Ancylostoma duodenale]|uniref:Uncharacterized protein n=1 Tax=Ancylostoma duodenale TaxID=51022 RepID=A0A0C2DJK3_9BILA|nr:hypothetical protein ANCDUO_07028 [Ancylostoma duodenale]